jgi:putative LysE/RhtB family amino acid efflux pump
VHGFVVGFGLGFVVALQLGPISLFLIRSTMRGGAQVGLAIGAGVAAIDALYAAAGAAGAAPFLSIDPVRLGLGLVGAGVLLVLGLRSLLTAIHVRAGLEATDDVASPRRAFLTALAATASNPSTIVSWAAIFAAASAATDSAPLPLVSGVGLGSLAWMSLLATGVAVLRRRVGARSVRTVDGLAGLGLVAFAGVLGYRALQEG